MSSIPPALRRLVIHRAAHRCEYCQLAQVGQEATFHIDHIEPESDGGETAEDNLALACTSCSLRKGSRRSAMDADTGKRARLFHPRRHKWGDHFWWAGAYIERLTPTGRATIELQKLNRPRIVAIREEETLRGRHPPP